MLHVPFLDSSCTGEGDAQVGGVDLHCQMLCSVFKAPSSEERVLNEYKDDLVPAFHVLTF